MKNILRAPLDSLNRCYVGVPFAAATLAVAAACQPIGPVPDKTPSADHLTAEPIGVPSCTINVIVRGRRATFDLAVRNGFEPGVYSIKDKAVRYNFGDNTSTSQGEVNGERHNYLAPGIYEVHAALTMEFMAGADVPFSGDTVPCTPTKVTIK